MLVCTLALLLTRYSPHFLLPHTPPPDTHTLSLHDALPIFIDRARSRHETPSADSIWLRLDDDALGEKLAEMRAHPHLEDEVGRSEEHTSELQSPCNLVCRLLLEKKKKKTTVSILQQ